MFGLWFNVWFDWKLLEEVSEWIPLQRRSRGLEILSWTTKNKEQHKHNHKQYKLIVFCFNSEYPFYVSFLMFYNLIYCGSWTSFRFDRIIHNIAKLANLTMGIIKISDLLICSSNLWISKRVCLFFLKITAIARNNPIRSKPTLTFQLH